MPKGSSQQQLRQEGLSNEQMLLFVIKALASVVSHVKLGWCVMTARQSTFHAVGYRGLLQCQC